MFSGDNISLSLWTHRHGLAAVEGSDGRLGSLAAAQLHEGAALAGSVRAPAFLNDIHKSSNKRMILKCNIDKILYM